MDRHYLYFAEDEFQKLTPSCSLSDMDNEFMKMLDEARSLSGVPFFLSCAFRSVSWDKAKGRSGKSWHTKGKAVDIRCSDSNYRYKLISALLRVGMTGIIVYPTFIHVDIRDTKPIFLVSHV